MKRLLSKILKPKNVDPENYHMGEPTLENPISQLCTYSQFNSQVYHDWCKVIHETPRRHRKQWEFVYILEVLRQKEMLKDGRAGVGFGVGTEPLSAVFAANGCTVIATDLDVDEAKGLGWIDTNQHANSLHALNERGICPQHIFQDRVSFRSVDMNAIPDNMRLAQYDFNWSACCLEHLGDLKKGLDFIRNSLKLLKPGGVAVHTTEFNLSSENETLKSGPTVIYRKKDILEFVASIKKQGYNIELNLNPGEHALDRYYDIPPYRSDYHLRLLMDQYVSTSIGLVITRPRSTQS